MTRPWFDPRTGLLLLDEYVLEMPSFKTVVADDVVTDQEVRGQAAKVTDLLKKLEAILPPDAKSLATDALCELAVLYALQRRLDGRFV
jgi:hypothetical protein